MSTSINGVADLDKAAKNAGPKTRETLRKNISKIVKGVVIVIFITAMVVIGYDIMNSRQRQSLAAAGSSGATTTVTEPVEYVVMVGGTKTKVFMRDRWCATFDPIEALNLERSGTEAGSTHVLLSTKDGSTIPVIVRFFPPSHPNFKVYCSS